MSNMNHPCDWTEISDPTVLVKQPLVSVHMITYNHEAFLTEAIECVLRQQTEYPYELIIGEDCSKDNTRRIALEYQRRFPEKIRVLYSNWNVGMHLNSQRVFEACRGKYVAYCEGDDYWHHPQKLQKQTEFLEDADECSLVHSDYDIQAGFRAMKATNHRARRQIATGDVFEHLLLENFIATCTTCVRVEVVREYFSSSFPAKGYPLGDWPLWLFASRKGRVEYIDESLATYRLNPGSVTHSGLVFHVKSILSLRQMREDYIEVFGCSEDLLHGVRTANNSNALVASALAGDRQMFFREFNWFRRNNIGWRNGYKTWLRFFIMKCHLSCVLRLRYYIQVRLHLM